MSRKLVKRSHIGMESDIASSMTEFLEDLRQRYAEADRCRAIQLQVCDSILSSERREWIQVKEPNQPAP